MPRRTRLSCSHNGYILSFFGRSPPRLIVRMHFEAEGSRSSVATSPTSDLISAPTNTRSAMRGRWLQLALLSIPLVAAWQASLARSDDDCRSLPRTCDARLRTSDRLLRLHQAGRMPEQRRVPGCVRHLRLHCGLWRRRLLQAARRFPGPGQEEAPATDGQRHGLHRWLQRADLQWCETVLDSDWLDSCCCSVRQRQRLHTARASRGWQANLQVLPANSAGPDERP
jgi:hypothetical protein